MPRRVRKPNKASENIEVDAPSDEVLESNNEDEEVYNEVSISRPHRKSRDTKSFDRADYIAARDTPMVNSTKRKAIQNVLKTDTSDNGESEDEEDEFFSDDETENIVHRLNVIKNSKKYDMELITILVMADSLSENAKLEAARMKNISDKANKLSKMVSEMIKNR